MYVRRVTEFDRGSRFFFLKCKFACVKAIRCTSGACPGIGKGGGGPKSESLFLFLLFNFSGGGGPAQKKAEKMIF